MPRQGRLNPTGDENRFFADMSLFSQEAGRDAPIGFFQETCNFVGWAPREHESIVKKRKVNEADIEEEINNALGRRVYAKEY